MKLVVHETKPEAIAERNLPDGEYYGQVRGGAGAAFVKRGQKLFIFTESGYMTCVPISEAGDTVKAHPAKLTITVDAVGSY